MSFKLWSYLDKSSPLKKTVDQAFKTWGHYSLYRRYDVGNQSTFYSDATGSSSGGPKWAYSDEIVKNRHAPMSVRGSVGMTINASKIYLQSDVNPKRGDVIIELDYNDHGGPIDLNALYAADHREAFEIQEIDTKRGYKGNIIFYLVQVVPHMGDY